MTAPAAHIADLRRALHPGSKPVPDGKPMRISVMTAPPSPDRLWIDAEEQAWRRPHRLVRCSQCYHQEINRGAPWCTQDRAPTMADDREHLCMVVMLRPQFRERG